MAMARYAALLGAALMGLAAFAQGALTVTVDQTIPIRLSQPVLTVVVGNPSIADVVSTDGRVLFVTGKSFGTTNVIALDGNGNPVFETLVSVSGQRMGQVTILRGTKQSTYSCTPDCRIAPMIGDDEETFARTVGQVGAKAGTAGN